MCNFVATGYDRHHTTVTSADRNNLTLSSDSFRSWSVCQVSEFKFYGISKVPTRVCQIMPQITPRTLPCSFLQINCVLIIFWGTVKYTLEVRSVRDG
jgi:hypothetical protein